MKKNNQYCAPWIGTLIVGLYTLWGGRQVLDETLTLGDFLVNLEIFKEIGVSWGDIYSVILDMQSTFPALDHIVQFLNLPTDVGRRKILSRQRRAFAKKQSMLQGADENPNDLDHQPLILDNVRYMYPSHRQESRHEGVSGTFTIEQGTLVALIGMGGNGKSTMLKVIGGVLLPDSGINIPPHLRVLHISEQPLFFEGTLKDNLLFGVSPGDPDGSQQRVAHVLEELLVPERLRKLVYMGDAPVMNWGETLSLTQRVLLNIARALIANPEVLCIHRPTRAFDRDTDEFENTLRMLKMFVTDKGVAQDPKTKHMRRPRTCIMSAGSRAAKMDNVFDAVFEVKGNEGVEQKPMSF